MNKKGLIREPCDICNSKVGVRWAVRFKGDSILNLCPKCSELSDEELRKQVNKRRVK